MVRQVVRNLLKQRLYTLLNVTGLTLGLLVFFTLLLYLQHQHSFDRFHSRSSQIYRLTSATKERVAAIVPYTWGYHMRQEIAAIENVVSFQNITIALTVRQEDKVFAQHGFLGVDSTFLDVFDFPVLVGNEKEFLQSPNKMLITPEIAKKYFGSQDPIGQLLQVNLWGTFVTYEVEGVVQCPPNSHIQFKFLIPIQLVKKHFFSPSAFASWTSHFAHTYFVLSPGFDYSGLKKDMKVFLERHGGSSLREKFTPDIQSLEDIYLKSDLRFDFKPRGDYRHVLILWAVAFGVIAMAVINFINISAAQSLRAVKEASLRKIMGAGRRQIWIQLMIGSILLTSIATVLASIGLVIVLPVFNTMADTTFTWQGVLSTHYLTVAIGMMVLIGVLSAVYPAFLLASFDPLSVLSSRSGNQLKSSQSRKILVVVQFALAVLLLIATGVIHHQVEYMRQKDLGFNKDQVIVLNGANVVASDETKMQLLRNSILKHEGVQYVTSCSSFPGDVESHWSSRYLPVGWPTSESVSLWTIYADHYFAKTFDLEWSAGRDFDKNIQSDSSGLLLNEAAIRHFSNSDPSWSEQALGKTLTYRGGQRKGRVIGVLKDFHFETLKESLNPLVIQLGIENAFSIQIKLADANLNTSISALENEWKQLFPEIPFDYTFLDQKLARHFDADQKLGVLLQLISGLAVVIAGLGLFGLATFMVYQKSREMSIRKVIGASETQLVRLLAWDFLKLVLLANLMAIPMGHLAMNRWLQGFAFRAPLSPSVFVLAGIFSVLVAALAILQQAFKTATQNPVDVLSQDR